MQKKKFHRQPVRAENERFAMKIYGMLLRRVNYQNYTHFITVYAKKKISPPTGTRWKWAVCDENERYDIVKGWLRNLEAHYVFYANIRSKKISPHTDHFHS